MAIVYIYCNYINMKNLVGIIGAFAATLALVSCDVLPTGESESWSPAELDSTVEEVWIGDTGGKVVPLDQWLRSNNENTLEWISRNDALTLHGATRKNFGIELSAISETMLPNYTVAVVATIPKGIDRSSLKRFLESAPSKFQVEVELGNKWLALDGLLADGGEYVLK